MILTLAREPPARLDMADITPGLCAQKSAREVAALKLPMGRERPALGDFFEVSDEEPERLVVRESGPRLGGLGARMADGKMLVEGDAGDLLAAGMRGGEITVRGNAGHHCAARMSGGRVTVEGDAGRFIGGALPGHMRGMKGGAVVVHGNVGDRAADRMRGGLLVVGGRAGAHCAARILAGTVVALGGCGPRAAVGMRRGTLALGSADTFEDPFFHPSGRYAGVFMTLLMRHLRGLDERFSRLPTNCPSQRCIGDASVAGKGEVLVLELPPGGLGGPPATA